MKTKLNRKELLSALETVSPAISTSTTIPEAQAVKLTSSAGTMVVTAQSPLLGAEMSVTNKCDEPGVAVVPHGKLVALLQGNSEEVELTAKDGRLHIKMGRTNAAISTYDPAGFINTPDIKCNALVTIGGRELADVLHISVAAAGDGTQQSWHEGVCFRSNPDGVMVYAADGKQFSNIMLPETGSMDFESVIPSRELKRIIGTIAPCESVSLMFGERGLRVTCDDAAFTIQAMELKYPDVKTVSDRFDTECVHSLKVSRDALVTSLRQASVLQTAIEFNVKLSSTGDGLRITSQSGGDGGYDDVVESANGENFVEMPETGINHKMLLAHLQSFKCNTITLHYAPGCFVLKLVPENSQCRNYYTSTIRKTEKKS